MKTVFLLASPFAASVPLAPVLLALLVIGAGTSGAAAVETRRIEPPVLDDPALESAVLARISGRPGIDVSRITVEVRGGVLALGGKARSLHEKAEVERYAGGVRGIVSVKETVDIDRVDGGDPFLQNEAERALRSSPRLNSFGLAIAVAGSAATLSGEVPVVRDRENAEEAVSRVPGIVSIRNEIRLSSAPVDPLVIKKRVEGLLLNKLIFARVADLRVEVAEGGKVTLEGSAGTLADRRRAEQVTYGVRGVSEVVNRIEVRPAGK